MADRQIAFVVDATRCINCKTCEIACKDIKAAPVGVRLRKVRTFEAGEFPAVFVSNISMSCNHCEDPLCARHCPASAYEKRSDGIVVHHSERCIGCRYCTWTCPYGAPQFDAAEGRIRKCDLCADELDIGKQPACVLACPTRAITLGSLDEATRDPNLTNDLVNVPQPGLTKPATRYRVRKEARNG